MSYSAKKVFKRADELTFPLEGASELEKVVTSLPLLLDSQAPFFCDSITLMLFCELETLSD